MNTRNVDLAAAIAARCVGPFGRTAVMPCERTLRIGFFFDGFGRHLIKDLQSGRVSNVGKLYLAHPRTQQDEAFFNYRRWYLPGLGEDYDADLSDIVEGTWHNTTDATNEVPDGMLQEQVENAAKEVLEGRKWWESLRRDVGDLAHHPTRAAGVFKDAAIGAAAEIVPPLRDSPFSAHLLKSGADTRIDGAIDRLNRDIDEIKAEGGVPLKRIELSVYGFDYGATLARAFLHRLLEQCVEKEEEVVEYQGMRLLVLFAGLFDGVDRSHADMPPLDLALVRVPLPRRNVLDDGGGLPNAVREALHLVAGHERRFYRRARLLGAGKPEWREELLPGVSEDIGGSLLPGEQKPSAELALVALHRMYRAAYRAGVPFPHLEDLADVDMKAAQLFTFNDHFNGHSALLLVDRYQQLAQAAGTDFAGRLPAAACGFLGHMRLYIRWLAELRRPYVQQLKVIEQRLDREKAGPYEPGGLRGMLGLPAESRRQQEERWRRINALQDEQRALQRQFAWLDEVDHEAARLYENLRVIGWRAAGSAEQAQIWTVLLNEWHAANPQPLPEAARQLFNHYIHDQLVLDTAQRSLHSITGQNYFDIRGYDRPAAS